MYTQILITTTTTTTTMGMFIKRSILYKYIQFKIIINNYSTRLRDKCETRPTKTSSRNSSAEHHRVVKGSIPVRGQHRWTQSGIHKQPLSTSNCVDRCVYLVNVSNNGRYHVAAFDFTKLESDLNL